MKGARRHGENGSGQLMRLLMVRLGRHNQGGQRMVLLSLILSMRITTDLLHPLRRGQEPERIDLPLQCRVR